MEPFVICKRVNEREVKVLYNVTCFRNCCGWRESRDSTLFEYYPNVYTSESWNPFRELSVYVLYESSRLLSAVVVSAPSKADQLCFCSNISQKLHDLQLKPTIYNFLLLFGWTWIRLIWVPANNTYTSKIEIFLYPLTLHDYFFFFFTHSIFHFTLNNLYYRYNFSFPPFGFHRGE